jgi:hypothetical protein
MEGIMKMEMQRGHHWYDGIVEAEHKAAHFLASDFDHTMADMNNVDRRFRRMVKRHPVAFASVETVVFVVGLFGLLVAQYYHAADMMP